MPKSISKSSLRANLDSQRGDSQWYASKLPLKIKVLICSVHQFLWCKYPHSSMISCCSVAHVVSDCDPVTHQTSMSFTVSQSLLKVMSIELVMPSSHLILCCPLLLPSIFPSIRVFSSESALHIRWPTYWSFSISPSNEYSKLIPFRINWFDHLVVQGTLKNLLQYHDSKASILLCSVFFMVKLSHPYMTTGKTIALPIQTFVGKVMSLLYDMLPKFVTAFLPRSKCLSISWLQSPTLVIL